MRYNYSGAPGGSRHHQGGPLRTMILTKTIKSETADHLPWRIGMWRLGLLDHRRINPHRVAETVLEGKRGSWRSPPDSVITSRGKQDVNGRGAETPPAETSPAGVTNRGPAAERGARATTDRVNARNAGDVMPPEAETTDLSASVHGGVMPPKAETTDPSVSGHGGAMPPRAGTAELNEKNREAERATPDEIGHAVRNVVLIKRPAASIRGTAESEGGVRMSWIGYAKSTPEVREDGVIDERTIPGGAEKGPSRGRGTEAVILREAPLVTEAPAEEVRAGTPEVRRLRPLT